MGQLVGNAQPPPAFDQSDCLAAVRRSLDGVRALLSRHRSSTRSFGSGGAGQQYATQPGAQLASGGNGERHHQQSVDRQLRFHHQPRRQRGQGVGLASASAGFDQQIAVECSV